MVCRFVEVTQVALVCGCGRFFFLIELDFFIVFFFFSFSFYFFVMIFLKKLFLSILFFNIKIIENLAL